MIDKKGTLLAYRLTGEDVGTTMCASADHLNEGAEGLEVCSACGYRLECEAINPVFKMPKRSMDISFTYDGYCIVHKRIREAIQSKYSNVTFKQLPNDPKYFVLYAEKTIECDPEILVFKQKCDQCNRYRSTNGYLVLAPHIDSPIEDGFYKSDLLRGTGHTKHHDIIIGIKTCEFLESLKMKEFYPDPMHKLSPEERERAISLKGTVGVKKTKKWWQFWQ